MKNYIPKSIGLEHAQVRSFARNAITALCIGVVMVVIASQSNAAEVRELNRADTKFVEQEAATSINAIRLSELAEKHSPSPEVQSFAKEVAVDQRKANKEITTFAAANNVEIKAVEIDDNTKIYTNLEKATRENFDREYLEAVITQNKRCVSDFETLSRNKDTNRDLQAWVDKMLPIAQARLAKAEALRNRLTVEATSVSNTL